MAVRPLSILNNAIRVTRVVTTGQTVALYQPVKFAATADEVQEAGAGDVAFGICTALGPDAGAAGDRIEITLLGHAVIPMEVGTGGATQGVGQQAVSDGVTDVTPNGAPTTGVLVGAIGLAMQTGVAGDYIGVMVPFPGYVLEE